MTLKDIQTMSEKELHEALLDARTKLHEFRFKAHEGQLKDVREIRVLRKNIARMLTVLTQKQTKKTESQTTSTV